MMRVKEQRVEATRRKAKGEDIDEISQSLGAQRGKRREKKKMKGRLPK